MPRLTPHQIRSAPLSELPSLLLSHTDDFKGEFEKFETQDFWALLHESGTRSGLPEALCGGVQLWLTTAIGLFTPATRAKGKEELAGFEKVETEMEHFQSTWGIQAVERNSVSWDRTKVSDFEEPPSPREKTLEEGEEGEEGLLVEEEKDMKRGEGEISSWKEPFGGRDKNYEVYIQAREHLNAFLLS